MISRRNALAAAAEPAVGLAERRAIAADREGRCLAQEWAIQAAAGFPVPVEVVWDRRIILGDAQDYADPGDCEKTIVESLAAGLKDVF